MQSKSDAILAQSMERGQGGLRIVIKDSIDVAGFPTACGSAAFADVPAASTDAEIVGHLLAGGGRLVGKANMHEFAYGVTGINDWTGTPRNSRYPGLIPGGSSSGSAAAVAAGIAEIAIGTDTGGSIRVPAACCGQYGLKPTFGRVSRRGVGPASSSLDCVGPIAASMAGIVRGMELIDPSFVAVTEPESITLGRVPVPAEPDVEAAFQDALERSGIRVEAVALPSFSAAYDAGIAIMAAETFAAYGRFAQDERVGEAVRQRLQGAGAVTASMIVEAEAVRERFAGEVDAALALVDALVLPTLPIVPPRLCEAGDARNALRLTSLVRSFNVSGHPAITLPIETAAGWPAGIQLVARRGDDPRLCAIAAMVARRAALPDVCEG